jgi:hypothetical protein
VLVPSVESIVERETERGSNSYRDWRKPGMTLADAVASLQQGLRELPRRGLWLDTTGQTAEESVAEILEDDLKASLF